MLLHRAFVLAEGFGEDELIMLPASLPTMSNVELMGVILPIPGQIGLRRRLLRVRGGR